VDIQRLRGKALRRYRRNLQLMFQDPYASLDPRMRVGTILREPLAVQGIGDRAERDRRVHHILEEVGLAVSAEDRYPHELSGGQRQRIAIARTLAAASREAADGECSPLGAPVLLLALG
jgi:peptide/nickel transport system ATP-binding protein